MELNGILSVLRQDLSTQLDINSKQSETSICHGEPAKKASKLMQSIMCDEKENNISAVHSQTGWTKSLG